MQSPSLDHLKTCVTKYFGRTPRFATDPVSLSYDENFVFFGNIIDLLLRTEQFTDVRPHKLWAFSRGHAVLVENYLHLPPDSIGIFSRYELFPLKAKPGLLNLREEIQLVYSGRIVKGKNVHLLASLAQVLRSAYGVNICIHVAHPQFDETLDELKSASKKISIPVIDHGDQGFDWIQKLQLPNPLFVNLSTYSCEDFNVSVAQAQSWGWPILVSSWAAFLDLSGPGVEWLTLDALKNMNSFPEKVVKAVESLSRSQLLPFKDWSRAAVELSQIDLNERSRSGRKNFYEANILKRDFLDRFILLSLTSPENFKNQA